MKDLAGEALTGVTIAIHDQAEYGTVITDSGGRFTIPVEGGSNLTVSYQKSGLINSHRQVYVPWNDIAIAETVQLLARDNRATAILFDGNAATVMTHQSTPVTDASGTRSATLVFPGDNLAHEVDAVGNVLRELTSITTRATEYVTPESMPAKLPPNSAFTYCAELEVDGVQRVRFEKPVVTWVDNFLGFPVGETVPVGYYDRDRGVWVPADSGVVVRLLDTNNDGLGDALDADGDGQPDDLNGNGSFADEVAGLSDPGRYPPGATFWRVALTHFSPLDANWAWAPPDNSTFPKGIPDNDQKKKGTVENSQDLSWRSGVASFMKTSTSQEQT